MDGLKKNLSNVLKHNEKLLTAFSKVASFFVRGYGKFLPINNNLLLITANSMGYNDSPRVIFEEIMKRKELDHLEIVWALEDSSKLPAKYKERVKVIKPDTIKYFKTALKSKYWLSSVNIERGLHFKKDETIFLNTWHGIPIKTVGNAVKNRNDFDWSQTDFVCYSNEGEKDIYTRDFKAKEESMVPCGLPRNDDLYNIEKDDIKNIKIDLGLDTNKKIILYAPTWRDNNGIGNNYKIDLPINWDLWEQELGDEYIILLKTHPYTTKMMGIKFNSFVHDYSEYSNINDLLIISDILISDYSSVIYDYSILEKPIICFAYDYKEYKNSRGIYVDLNKEMPNGIVKDELEVISQIITIDFNKQSSKTKKLKEKRVTYGGNATETCIGLLLEGKSNGRKN